MNEIKDLEFGKCVPVPVRIVTLHWSECSGSPSDIHSALQNLSTESGVYAFEARHDAHRHGAVLYVGESKRNARLGKRVSESFRAFAWPERSDDKSRWRFMSDVWDVKVRVAQVSGDAELVRSIERLLIAAHSPPFNSQKVRRTGVPKQDADLLVLNAGEKGLLLPVLLGAWLGAECWPAQFPRSPFAPK